MRPAGLLLIASIALYAVDDPAGAVLYKKHCATCHDTGKDGAADRYTLNVRRTPEEVLASITTGSMAQYARMLLHYVHAAVAARRRVEAFAFGTRLTRLTADLSGRDPERALEEATKRVADWSGGTRIGLSLKGFNDEWGRRALTRGAVVLVASDGWEREDASQVGLEMARLARQAYAVIWVNPLKGHPEYQPLAGGMRAALPFVDRFVPGQNLADLEELAAALAGIERRHAA